MRPILTAERMIAAEPAAIEAGTGVEQLIERAGAALAEAAYRFAGPLPALVLCNGRARSSRCRRIPYPLRC